MHLANCSDVFYVEPDSGDPCDHQNCHGLSYYVTRSLDSNSSLCFLPGKYILHSDFVIRALHNISLIGASEATNSTPSTIIQCNSSVSIVMINITGLIIRNMLIKDCGPTDPDMNIHEQGNGLFHKKAVTIDDCSSVHLKNIIVNNNNTNRGILVINSKDDSVLSSVTCSIALVYNNTAAFGSYLEIQGYCPVHNIVTLGCHIFLIVQNYSAMVIVRISDTSFISRDKVHFLYAVLLHHETKAYHKHGIQFTNCYFSYNIVNSMISVVGEEIRRCNIVLYVEFIDSQFISNRGGTQHSHVIDVIGGNIRTAITLQSCLFQNNTNVQLIDFVTSASFYCSQVGVIFIEDTTFSYNNVTCYLINASQALVYLEGSVLFTGIKGDGIIVVISYREWKKSVLTCHGNISVLNNNLKEFLCYSGEYNDLSIAVKEYTNILIKHNVFYNAFFFTSASRWDIDPRPLCFFQFFSSHIDPDTAFYSEHVLNYSIAFENNNMSEIIINTYSKFTHCSWYRDAVFQQIIPLSVNQRFVRFKENSIQPWVIKNKMLCICQNGSPHHCNDADQFGPIYPGETLFLSMYKRGYNHFSNKFYYKFHKKSLATMCKSLVPTDIAFSFLSCVDVNLTVWSTHSNWCEVFVQNPITDINFYDGHFDFDSFYVLFHPGCPVGFAKYTEKCECDHVLEYIGVFTCNINDRTIIRPANSWITATTNNYSHNYTVSQKCPFDYCLPQSSHLDLSFPNSQCQFNRSGLSCGQCQQGLSAVFGSSQCHHCSNIYLLLVLVFAVLGIVLLLVMFTINFTVTDGSINGFIFYVNIASINDSVFFPLHQFSYVFISIANLDLGIQTCFYNGMDDYAKMWLQLVFPLYLILIAVSLIITSRHSTTVQRLTARRALPVLATLFLLSYTKILRTVSNVLFSYFSIITLPSQTIALLWVVDANVTVFGVKFTILFVVCLVLFLLMIPFNFILTFVRFFSQFRLITRLKPLLDAFQGPYKVSYNFWCGLQLLMRAVFFALSSLDRNFNLPISIILLSLLLGIRGLLRPLKSKVQNFQEFVWLMNLQGLYVFSLYGQGSTSITFVNILVVIAMVHFSFIVIYHIITYTWIGDRIVSVCPCVAVSNVIRSSVGFLFKEAAANHPEGIRMNKLPEEVYCEYREPLVGL